MMLSAPVSASRRAHDATSSSSVRKIELRRTRAVPEQLEQRRLEAGLELDEGIVEQEREALAAGAEMTHFARAG